VFYTGKGRDYLGQREEEVNKLNGQKGFRERGLAWHFDA